MTDNLVIIIGLVFVYSLGFIIGYVVGKEKKK